MKIDFSNNVSTFEMNFHFYDYPAIIEAAKEFTDSCYIAIKSNEDENAFNIRIEPKTNEFTVQEATYEFLNYTLGIMNRKIKNLFL